MPDEEVVEQVPTCPQCGAPNYSPENDQAEHDYTCSMAPVAQIQPEEPAAEPAPVEAEPVPEQEAPASDPES